MSAAPETAAGLPCVREAASSDENTRAAERHTKLPQPQLPQSHPPKPAPQRPEESAFRSAQESPLPGSASSKAASHAESAQYQILAPAPAPNPNSDSPASESVQCPRARSTVPRHVSRHARKA